MHQCFDWYMHNYIYCYFSSMLRCLQSCAPDCFHGFGCDICMGSVSNALLNVQVYSGLHTKLSHIHIHTYINSIILTVSLC